MASANGLRFALILKKSFSSLPKGLISQDPGVRVYCFRFTQGSKLNRYCVSLRRITLVEVSFSDYE